MTRICAYCRRPILEGQVAVARFDGGVVHAQRRECVTTSEGYKIEAIKRATRYGRKAPH